MRWRGLTGILSIAVLLLTVQTGVSAPTGKTRFVPEYGKYKLGGELPHVLLKQQDGSLTFTKRFAYGNGGTIFTFFQTSCKPCLAGLKELTTSADKLAQLGISVTAIHVKELSKESGGKKQLTAAEVGQWIAANGLSFGSVLYDENGALRDSGIISDKGSVTLPITVAVNGKRVVSAISMEEGADYVSGMVSRIQTKK